MGQVQRSDNKDTIDLPIKDNGMMNSALPKVDKDNTADLRDVYARLEQQSYVSYVAHFLGGDCYRFQYWVSTKLFPKGWF
jgi:hypothetical protein